ncbi:MAG: HAD-IA family hydrolase [Candidatus Diapherotrites archaeon]|nr:HAD-IA family hydrolase [Candidatus Diapherotrites archaeon]
MDDLLFWIVAAAFAGYLLKTLLFQSKKGIIAFDLGGVFAKGDYFTEVVKEREGMRRLIKSLKRKYKVVLLSNQNSEAHAVFEKKFGLPKLFDEQIVSGRVGVKKPDPKIFQLVQQRFKVKPEKITFIDDDAANVEAAKKAGINGIRFTSISQIVGDLRKTGVDV